MDREMFNIWMDEPYERQGSFGMTNVESDVDYNIFLEEEEEQDE